LNVQHDRYKQDLLWTLESDPGKTRSIIYGLQWFAFSAINVAIIPIVIGPYLGLDQAGIAELAQRSFFFVGIASLLQVLFGHRYPILEGPAAHLWALAINLGAMAAAAGGSLQLLRSDLAGMMIVCGALIFILGLTGAVGKLMQLFTPIVTGVVMILLCIQLSGPLVGGLINFSVEGGRNDYYQLISGLAVIITVILVSMKAPTLIRSLNVLIGLAVGWAVHLALAGEPPALIETTAFALPRLFAWGLPTFNPGIIITGVVVYLVLLANLIASVAAMEKATGKEAGKDEYNRAVIYNGISNFLAGAAASLGTVAFSASTGVVKLSGVAARKPFIIGCLLLITLGFFPPAGIIASAVPRPVGYALLIAVFTQILLVGLKQLTLLNLDQRDSFVLGISIIFGAGINALPPGALDGLPELARYIVGNAMVMGTIIALLLEHLALPKRNIPPAKEDGKTMV
jgi:xanthine/uracil permease